MGHRPDGGGDIEPSCKLGDLQISVKGPLDQATDFIRSITAPGSTAAGRGSSQCSFELVSDAGYVAAPSRTLESRDQIIASFADCPLYLSKQAGKLSGSATSGVERAKRAWRAGQ